MKLCIETNGCDIDVTNHGNLCQYLERERIDFFKDLDVVEIIDECFIIVMNLTMYSNNCIDLKSGMNIGLSNWLNMMIVCLVNNDNDDLKRELNDLGAIIAGPDNVLIILELNKIVNDFFSKIKQLHRPIDTDGSREVLLETLRMSWEEGLNKSRSSNVKIDSLKDRFKQT